MFWFGGGEVDLNSPHRKQAFQKRPSRNRPSQKGGSYVLVWGRGGGFKAPSQKAHLPKETLQESTLSKRGLIRSGLGVGGWILSPIAERAPHKRGPSETTPNIGDPPMFHPVGMGVRSNNPRRKQAFQKRPFRIRPPSKETLLRFTMWPGGWI
jgi:hypothetical protein